MGGQRVFEFTSEELAVSFRPDGNLQVNRLMKLPCLFVSESDRTSSQLAQVGWITSIESSPKGYTVQFRVNPRISPITNRRLYELSSDLGIDEWEFSRTHWAIKDVDLFEVLLMSQSSQIAAPRVFSLDPMESVDANLISVMMPFDAQFDDVYTTIQAATTDAAMTCLRADDIWEHDHVIQDIVSLVNRSKIVICDCTGRNPNVFYEIGIAHTLGRDVILITQNKEDIPFDLRHLRYISYLNNNEGRERLRSDLNRRIATLIK